MKTCLLLNSIVSIMSKHKTIKNKVESVPAKAGILDSHFFLKASLLLVFITSTIYFQSLNNKLTNWDDNKYITDNPGITTLHGDSIGYTIKNAFTSYVMGNYHPLTMLSYSVEYSLFKLNPKPYHVTNLLIHIFNTLLVMYFIWLLCKQKWVALITALLFANTSYACGICCLGFGTQRCTVYFFLFTGFLHLYSLC